MQRKGGLRHDGPSPRVSTPHGPHEAPCSRLRVRRGRSPPADRRSPDAGDLEPWSTGGLPACPLEHILGWAEFCGLRIAVDTGVFVPRRRTEFLVRQAVALLTGARADTGRRPAPVVVDLCCGSGAVGAALAALPWTRSNCTPPISTPPPWRARAPQPPAAGRRGPRGRSLRAAPGASCAAASTVLAVNAPYVPRRRSAPCRRRPACTSRGPALDGGADGLEVQRRVAAAAPQWLAPGGYLLIETSRRQAAQTVESFAARTGGPGRYLRGAGRHGGDRNARLP